MRLVSLILFLALSACIKNFGVQEIDGETFCDNLDTSACLFPFPTDYFRQNGKLVFAQDAFPRDTNGNTVDVARFARREGWSSITPIYFTFDGAVLDGAPTAVTMNTSLDVASKTLILDGETGALIAHFAELDWFSVEDGRPIISLRLAKRLADKHRYIVAVKGLATAAGAVLPATPGFAALRDETGSTWKGIDARRDHYERLIFPLLDKAGVKRADLQLAWDFTTDSDFNVTNELVVARDRILAAIGDEGPSYTVTKVDEFTMEQNAHIARIVHITVEIPSVLEVTDIAGIPGLRRFRRDASHLPLVEGVERREIELQIPRSVEAQTAPAAVVQYGHGFIGSRNEARRAWLQKLANDNNFAIVAMDMQGMSNPDLSDWAAALGGGGNGMTYIAEKVQQGMVNHIAVVQLLRTRFLKEADARFTRAGQPFYDPNRIYYYGNSQGGTLGGVMMSVHPYVTRGVAGVPGGAFNFLLTRAADFAAYSLLFRGLYPKPPDFLSLMGIVQMALDPIDACNYLPHARGPDLFANTPEHRVLFHVAIADAQVNNGVSQTVALCAGAELIQPAVRPLFGFETKNGPYSGHAIAEYDFNKPPNPKPNYPASKDYDTHEDLRRAPKAQLQAMHFLYNDEFKHFCDGPCNPD